MRNDPKGKAQGSSGAAKNELSEIMTAVMRIAEKLETLEKKTDLLISQTSFRSSGGREHPKPVPPPVVMSQPLRQLEPSQPPNEAKAAHGQPRGHARERRERVLHKAVCADCHKDCEIPFKPTGERPVYCKECFSKRKAAHSSQTSDGNRPAPHNPPEVAVEVSPLQRKVVVTKKGVGKVTVSEIVRPSSRDSSPKGKSPRPDKKSKR